jgi:LmbE family N-acetylglucosaminyl deacetylase
VATAVFVHAHPDDEASQTSGSMARAASEGHRVVVVYGTGGEHGEAPDDLAPGETVVHRRRAEAEASARATGTARVAWLGYADSGMTGWEQNSAPDAFCAADLDEAAGRLAAVLDEEDADVVVGYDWHGGYGHPDHVMVHRVVHRAAALARRRPRLLESTMNRDALRRVFDQSKAAGQADDEWDPDAPADDGNPIGLPEAEIHWQVDVGAFLPQRRAALEAHRSQTSDVGQMLAMPPEVFAMFFGTEHYVEPGRPPGMRRGWFLDGADPAQVRADEVEPPPAEPRPG